MHKTLIVTNDFPPRPGGIQAFLHNMALRLDPERIVVYASTWKRSQEGVRATADFDAEQPFTVVRDRTTMLLPTPAVTRRAVALLREHGCTSVWFGAAAPLGLMAPALRRAGAERLVATTHGHEAGWAQLPGARQLLRRIGEGTDTITYLGEYTRSRIATALTPDAAGRMVQLPPGVDEKTFHPGSGGAEVRARLGLTDRPVVVCVSRLVPRKGQDTLIRAMPGILAKEPDAVLLIVGGGPYEKELRGLARETGVAGSVRFTGAVPWAELPAHYGAGDVFAMPCRTRRGGLDVEGLGIVYLEASATGLPVVAGDSGGAPDAVLDGETGWVVRGGSPTDTAERVVTLLGDPELRARMGQRGREWVEEKWRWDLLAETLKTLL
ncbi:MULTISPECIES: glycosyltransferase family 4 protein [Streptomyces]|uniref:phosphatidyl-myo-inositol dimannoside synthase n=1 Tax=Streptomyces stelliscabiei TaxID=146820 RepID=A0A8I0P5B2_9ACTN|nr:MULTISPECIES: glycosyltransferase family 4 protein [Streptomyces]KND41252.1 GDP-mannose-dependent alpha-(1-6)-phosphatidylinositol monomannoside mannosyltransferase [Streptomyces stelliscabiei]MBE1596459.1 phosphatidylinositol alpha-1,6-mannosyltransferase [Streptomyces stelliscabiei]MDX2521542.1 glycosyltransferase family 4 protein [Streptomyces stelliscabiei]MDX2557513.1 glycosyltransferase family 4 protein [Streptomyces stelliscabiei]MDX2617046.1 glycosyltransferase family 4 protein [Str